MVGGGEGGGLGWAGGESRHPGVVFCVASMNVSVSSQAALWMDAVSKTARASRNCSIVHSTQHHSSCPSALILSPNSHASISPANFPKTSPAFPNFQIDQHLGTFPAQKVARSIRAQTSRSPSPISQSLSTQEPPQTQPQGDRTPQALEASRPGRPSHRWRGFAVFLRTGSRSVIDALASDLVRRIWADVGCWGIASTGSSLGGCGPHASVAFPGIFFWS